MSYAPGRNDVLAHIPHWHDLNEMFMRREIGGLGNWHSMHFLLSGPSMCPGVRSEYAGSEECALLRDLLPYYVPFPGSPVSQAPLPQTGLLEAILHTTCLFSSLGTQRRCCCGSSLHLLARQLSVNADTVRVISLAYCEKVPPPPLFQKPARACAGAHI